MTVEVVRAELHEVDRMRDRFRASVGCQIVRDSVLWRGLAEPWLIRVDGHPAGYGSVWTAHFPGRALEFFLLPQYRGDTPALAWSFLSASGATQIEAQTNVPAMVDLLFTFATDIRQEYILFGDGAPGTLSVPGAVLRPRGAGDAGPEGERVVEWNGRVVAAGGIQGHYNPSYADLHMEVVPEARGLGIGSWLIQELARICREGGRIPAARCDPGNHASRRALERGGLRPCGRLLYGEVLPEITSGGGLPRPSASPAV